MSKASTWIHSGKKKGFKKSVGSYVTKKTKYGNDRQFNLVPVNGGKAVEYSSHEAAKRDGWKKEL